MGHVHDKGTVRSGVFGMKFCPYCGNELALVYYAYTEYDAFNGDKYYHVFSVFLECCHAGDEHFSFELVEPSDTPKFSLVKKSDEDNVYFFQDL